MPVITEGAKDSPTVCDVAVQAYVGAFDLTIAAILLFRLNVFSYRQSNNLKINYGQ